MVSKLLIVTL